MKCAIEARIEHLARFGEPAVGYPWATARQLEGRSIFEAFVECVQPGRGRVLPTATVAAALLIASGRLNRKLACDNCEIPEGGARSRVGTLAKQIKQFCDGCMPDLPDEWRVPEPAPVPATEVKAPKRKWQRDLQRPDLAATLTKYDRQSVIEDAALTPSRTRRVHVLQQHTPGGGCAIATYAADATPFDENKAGRGRRLGTNRERRRQAFKVLDMRLVERTFEGGDESFKMYKRRLIAKMSDGRRAWLESKLAKAGPKLLDFNPGLLEALADPNHGHVPHAWAPEVDGRDLGLDVWDGVYLTKREFLADHLARGRWRCFERQSVWDGRVEDQGLCLEWDPEWCAETCPCRHAPDGGFPRMLFSL